MKTDELLELAPYDGSQEAETLFLQALQEETIFHYEHNYMYRRTVRASTLTSLLPLRRCLLYPSVCSRNWDLN